MKQSYSKPKISVELLTLDQPIASNCTTDRADMESLKELTGYFIDDLACSTTVTEGMTIDGHDTICYHSNVNALFYS